MAVAASAGAGAAEPPPAEYFSGLYIMIGRDGAVPPGLVNEEVVLRPEGAGLAVATCDGAGGALTFDSFGDLDNLLRGSIGHRAVWCMAHNNGDNYPLITCRGEGAERLTLWPQADRFGAAPDCG